MAKQARRTRKKLDPNQLSLLDYVPPAIEARSARNEKRSTRRLAPPIAHPIAGNADASPTVLTAQQAARYLNLSIATLKSWRAKNTGPAFVKRGARLIGYLPADLAAYLKAQR